MEAQAGEHAIHARDMQAYGAGRGGRGMGKSMYPRVVVGHHGRSSI